MVSVSRRVTLITAGYETAGFTAAYLLVSALYVWWSGLGVIDMVEVVAGSALLTFVWRYRASELPHPVVAGADWVGTLRGRKSHWLPLYELTQIDVGPARDDGGNPIAGTTSLSMWDGRARLLLGWDPAPLRTNPALWDLVFNGPRYSAAAGAKLTPATWQWLRLDRETGDRVEAATPDQSAVVRPAPVTSASSWA